MLGTEQSRLKKVSIKNVVSKKKTKIDFVSGDESVPMEPQEDIEEGPEEGSEAIPEEPEEAKRTAPPNPDTPEEEILEISDSPFRV